MIENCIETTSVSGPAEAELASGFIRAVRATGVLDERRLGDLARRIGAPAEPAIVLTLSA